MRAIDTANGAAIAKAIPALKNAGVSVVLMYFGIGGTNIPEKRATPEGCAALRKNGIDVSAVAESSAGWMSGGYSVGVDTAKKVRADVVRCGGPSDCFVWLADDTDSLTASQVIQCVKGAREVLGSGKVGIYGPAAVCKAVKKIYPDVKMWEAQSTGWTGFVGSVAARLQGFSMFQLMGHPYKELGVDYDGNDVFDSNIGQWGFKPAPAPAPAPAPTWPRKAIMLRNSQLWNTTHGTKRSPSPAKGGTVLVDKVTTDKNGTKWASIRWGGNSGDVLYKDIKYI